MSFSVFILENHSSPSNWSACIFSSIVKYVQKAFGICLIPNRKDLKIQVSNGIQTKENIDKYFARALPQLLKVAEQVENAKSLNYQISSLTGEQQEACRLLTASN